MKNCSIKAWKPGCISRKLTHPGFKVSRAASNGMASTNKDVWDAEKIVKVKLDGLLG